MDEEFTGIISNICEADSRYSPEAYEFVMEALAFSQKKFKKAKHISGEELLAGIRALLLKKFGPMTVTLLKAWGIKKTDDFGNIVYNLVQNKVLAKDTEDQYESFKNAYDFDEVFNKAYRKALAKRLKSMRF
jgi:uncharacterized repeat protein (TIGR04138 family)